MQMAEFKKVMEEKHRICNAYNNCENCPLHPLKNNRGIRCATAIENHIEEAEEIILKWAEEYPIRTNKDKFKEVFGLETALEGCAGFSCVEKCEDCPNKNFWDKEYIEPKGEE